jgi:hypothetical protein
MSGVNQSTISRRLQGDAYPEVLRGVVLTGGGLQGDAYLIPATLIFKWLLRDNVGLAEKMGEAGATLFIHRLAGYQHQQATPKPKVMTASEKVTAVNQLVVSLQLLNVDTSNPRFTQGLQDLVGDLLGLTPVTPATETNITLSWCGVAERAEQLGYKHSVVYQNRIGLGKYVAKQTKLKRRKENRLCAGTQRPINVYEVSPELDNAIRTYLNNRG